MLDEYYQCCREQADCLENWKNIDKNELINLAADCTDSHMRSIYVSAIMCKYWSALVASYHQSYMAATEGDVYDWFVETLLYVLDKKAWRNPNSKLFGDKDGPDKCFNIKLKCNRLTFFQQNNRYNRKINHGMESLDKLKEDTGDAEIPSDVVVFPDGYDFKYLVVNNWNSYNRFSAIIIDLILNSDVYDFNKSDNNNNSSDEDVSVQKDISKLIKRIRKLDSVYLNYFSREYNVRRADVEVEVRAMKNSSKKQLVNSILTFFNSLSR